MNLLFICTEARLRSKTAETVFNRYEGIHALSAGTNKDAITPLSGDLIEWADKIFVMEPVHLKKLNAKYSKLLRGIEVVKLDIKDNYKYMDESLIDLLESKLQKHI